MIQYSQHRTAIEIGRWAAWGSVAYGIAVAKPGHRRTPILLGLVGGLAFTGLKLAADAEEKDLVRNPEVMNGHFITGGTKSALASADDVPYLRALMGVPQHAPRRGGHHGHRLR